MDSVRQLKYAKLIKKELGELFLREGKNWYGSHFVTVTHVKITPDLGLARVHISVFKAPNPLEILKSLKKHNAEVRFHLGRKIGKLARIVPELEFFIDDTLDYSDKMDAIFKSIDIPPAEDSSDS